MGAIVGIFTVADSDHKRSETIEKMLKSVEHRAPYKKIFKSAKYGLGIRTDTKDYKLKCATSDKSRGIIAIIDGDIFDCRGINEPLKGKLSDAELIVIQYLKFGEDFPVNIDGSFTIAILDEMKKKIILLRDRTGTKPLYYHIDKNYILFASEIKGILASNICEKNPDIRAINYFLSYGYIPNPNTLFSSIMQVKPGQIVAFNNGKLSKKYYWRFRYKPKKQNFDEKSAVEEFKAIFETSVSRRIKRHPEFGAFLSGGIDTSCVTAVAASLADKKFKVFTAGFQEKKYNEINDAHIVAEHCGLDQFITTVRFDNNFPSFIENLVWHHDSPFVDTSAIPSYYAAKLAKEHVETVLTGDFPDQLIGGSGHHTFFLNRQKKEKIWKEIIRNRFLNRLFTSIKWSATSTSLIDKTKRYLYRETFPLEEQRIILSMPVPPLLKNALYTQDLLEIDNKNNPIDIARSIYRDVTETDLLDKLLYFDILSYATDDLMVKVDRMTSAHGLNAISPFHDIDLIEFISKMPQNMKIRGDEQKYILRRAFQDLLPKHTLEKRKQGFAMPIGEWLIRKLPNYVRDILLDDLTLNRGYFRKNVLTKIVDNFLAEKTDYAAGSEATIVALITLEIWHRVFFDQ